MQKLLGSLALIMIGAGMWRLTDLLSPDAIGMALGILFGMLAGIPVALLVLAANQRRPDPPRVEQQPTHHPHYPPVIVLTGGNHVPNQNRPNPQRPALLPGERRPHHPRRALPDTVWLGAVRLGEAR